MMKGPSRADILEMRLSRLQVAAERHATREYNRIEQIYREGEDATAEGDDFEPPAVRGIKNYGGEMIFDPPHQGSGFSGEFTDDDLMVPLWRDYSGPANGPGDPVSVFNLLVKAFRAGAQWGKKTAKVGKI